MRMVLAIVQRDNVLEYRDPSRLAIVLDGVDHYHAAAAFDVAGDPEQVRSTGNDFHGFGQSGVASEVGRDVPPDAVVAHQRIAEADDEQGLHRRRTRWTEQEMQGS